MTPIDPETLLGVRLSAICSNGRYTNDPGPVIAELIATAGDRADVLARECGTWAGYYASAETATLCTAIVASIPGAAEYVAEGQARRAAPSHGTSGYRTPPVRRVRSTNDTARSGGSA